MQQEINLWDKDSFLPGETYEFCRSVLTNIGFSESLRPPLRSREEIASPFYNQYITLRTTIQQHIDLGAEPQLGLLSTPTGARHWQPNPDIIRGENQVPVGNLETDEIGLDRDIEGDIGL